MFVIPAIIIVLVALVVLLPPPPVVRWIAEHSPRILFYVQTEERIVALTIDDGPDATETPAILNVLERHNAHATFFLIAGNVSGNEDLVERIIREDHEIAVHFSGFPPTVMYPASRFDRALGESAAILNRFAPTRWFRPSSGWYNSRMLDIAAKQGCRCVLASLYPHDPQVPSVAFATWFILGKIRPGEIIVLHDRKTRGLRTAAILERVLPQLQARGYEVMTVSALVQRSEAPTSP